VFTYTVILEFDGGTYISQIRARDEDGALKYWIANPSDEMLAGVRYTNKRELWIKRVVFDQTDETRNLASLNGAKNVWFFHFVQGSKLGIVHLVKTCINKN
jgi:hypothetical protein